MFLRYLENFGYLNKLTAFWAVFQLSSIVLSMLEIIQFSGFWLDTLHPCCLKNSFMPKMQNGANFCTTFLLFYHTTDWLNQQNLPKLQVAVYLFTLNWSTLWPFNKISSESKYRSNPMWAETLETWKVLWLSLFTIVVIGWNVFTQRELPFKIEFKYILFHKPTFHRLINSSSENATVSTWGKRIAAELYKMLVLIWIIT